MRLSPAATARSHPDCASCTVSLIESCPAPGESRATRRMGWKVAAKDHAVEAPVTAVLRTGAQLALKLFSAYLITTNIASYRTG